MAFQETPAHTAIFDAVRAKKSNIQINAVAGSGKTTTILKSLETVPSSEKVVFLAFNASIAKELATRVPRHVEARTLNSLGHRIWFSHCKAAAKPVPVVEGDKQRRLLNALVDSGKVSERDAKVFGGAALRLSSIAKASGMVPRDGPRLGFIPDTVEAWGELIDHQDLDLADIEGAFDRTVALARVLLSESLRRLDMIDFDDQLYLPYVFDVKPYRFDRVFVDEAQDLSPLQHDLLHRVLKVGGQLVAVGDPYQAIYGFRGADAKSMANMLTKFAMVPLPLHVSYRCPKAVVAVAQKVVPHIKAHADAPEGLVVPGVIPSSKADFLGGDMVVCRTTAPTVALAYSLLRKNVPVEVLGRDIGRGLVSLITQLKPVNVDDLLTRLEKWEGRELERAFRRNASDSKIAAITDKAATLRVLCEHTETIDALLAVIEGLFSGAPHSYKVTLCTVHKAKGLEADRVWILNPRLMPHPMAKIAWQREQEQNLIYVAVTRAKKELRYVFLANDAGEAV